MPFLHAYVITRRVGRFLCLAVLTLAVAGTGAVTAAEVHIAESGDAVVILDSGKTVILDQWVKDDLDWLRFDGTEERKAELEKLIERHAFGDRVRATAMRAYVEESDGYGVETSSAYSRITPGGTTTGNWGQRPSTPPRTGTWQRPQPQPDWQEPRHRPQPRSSAQPRYQVQPRYQTQPYGQAQRPRHIPTTRQYPSPSPRADARRDRPDPPGRDDTGYDNARRGNAGQARSGGFQAPGNIQGTISGTTTQPKSQAPRQVDGSLTSSSLSTTVVGPDPVASPSSLLLP